MKRIIISAAFLLMTISAASITGYNGSKNQPHIKGANPSGSVTEGDGWKLRFQESQIQMTNQTTGVTNYTFTGNKAEITGVVMLPQPCYTLKTSVEKQYSNNYVLKVQQKSPEKEVVCATVISYSQYKASFEADKPFKLEIKHEGETIQKIKHPKYRESTPKTKTNGPMKKIFNWLRGFF
jgi:hypothetical protein